MLPLAHVLSSEQQTFWHLDILLYQIVNRLLVVIESGKVAEFRCQAHFGSFFEDALDLGLRLCILLCLRLVAHLGPCVFG